MAFLDRFRRMRWSALSEDEIEDALARIAPQYEIKLVAFSAESIDGAVHQSDGLEIYVVNNGSMGEADMVEFIEEVERALRRSANFYTIRSDAERDEFDDIRVTVAFSR